LMFDLCLTKMIKLSMHIKKTRGPGSANKS